MAKGKRNNKPRFVVRHRKTGEVRTFGDANAVALFMWGRDVKDWLIYKLVPIFEPEVGAIREALQ